VDVGGRDGGRGGTGGELRGEVEAAAVLAEQDADVVAGDVDRRQVRGAVAVEVPDRQGLGQPAGVNGDRGLEGAVAVAPQQRELIALAGEGQVADDQIRVPVAVEAPDRHGQGCAAGRERLRGLEGAVAVAQEHAHGAAGEGGTVGGDEV